MADIPRRKPMPAGYQAAPPQLQPKPYGHSRTRTTSSNIFPTQPQPQQLYPNNMQVHAYTSRRTPSTNTFSTTASSGNGPVPQRQTSQDLRRSTSSRSNGASQPTGYVALMRKQKATVWCDRAQHEDPRLLAAQRQAKIRATMEVVGGKSHAGRVSTSGNASLAGSNRVAAKIRHGGKATLVGYSPGDLVGGVGGVPMRLSASEVEGGDSDDDGDSTIHHQRSGSGRSSVGSSRRGLTYSRTSGASSVVGRMSSGNSPPGERRDSIQEDDPGETPVPSTHPRAKDYFAADGGGDGARSTGSGSSGERADGVAELGSGDAARLASNSLLKSTITREKSVKNPDELRRRGSVDERTMTMSAGRLYIANPDADSD
ncbi:hypothetical protein LHYA1_G002500 [Lachnellula hyalina]|uniref:Uncharacterized protein n=1 Tax=Lachnellula hyalina TaxID=1316788 RepID=A0A8H8R7L4_9HELO|nr:uncharacterized protein LHYA1_G002500 [Lachnellula hyalina]TVY29091.1 hypothetical protein LHYA1_G002500 [Lachnellula hyalina]